MLTACVIMNYNYKGTALGNDDGGHFTCTVS